uniref:Nephrocystin 3-like N-terminal domain-containing protein n=1 Tax=Magallana gigas TaxID=29159 RepID=A0A8W8J315_MAGGI
MTTPEDTVGFGKKEIDPWCKHRWELIKLIDSDKEILREVFTLSESKISLPESMKNGEEFLDALDNYFEHKRDGIVDYLYRLASELKLHVNEGSTSVTSILETYKYQLREHNTRQKDCELVGREQEIECAIGCLRSAKCKGVWICGLGGMGKTSLAFEVCRKLFEEKWRIFNVELREQKYVRDLLRTALNVIDVSLLTSSSDEFSDKLIDSHATEGIEGDISDDNKHEFWKQRFVQKCCEYSDQNQVLILDNVDEIIASDEKSFYALLKSILERRKKVENSPDHVYGMYRFVITSRSGINPTRLENLLKVIELRGLTEKQAILFLKENSKFHTNQPAENEMKKVTSLCGCCPLAMLSVLGALQSLQDLPRDLTECLQSSNQSAIYVQSDVPRTEMCLHQLFYLLDEQYKITLMQLSVFRTTHFSIEAATHVCGKSKRSGKANMKLELGLLKNLHFLETPIKKFPENGQAQPTLSEMCYFHPLVYQVLRNNHSKFENYVTDARSRFVEHIDRVLSKTKEDSTSNLMKVMVTYEPHIQLFYDYVTQMPSMRPSFEDDVPSIVSAMNRERLTDLVLDDASKHKYIIQMIAASKTENKGLETVYYQIVLAKFYNDKDKIDMCRKLLEEIEDIVKSNENLSNEAIYIKRKQKSKDHIAALILSKFWTEKARFLNANENYSEAIKCLEYSLMAIKKRSKECWSIIARNNNLAGVISFKCKKYYEAELFYRKALEIITSHDESMDKDVYLTNIGTAMFMKTYKNMPCDTTSEDIQRYYTMALNLETTQRNNKARILSFRGKFYLSTNKLEESENDFRESLQIWKTLVQSPNINLISAYHYLSTLFLRKSTNLIKSNQETEAVMYLAKANANYKEILHQIRNGGLNNWQRNKVLYDQIKHNHKRVLHQLNREKDDIDEVMNFYLDFEDGKFENNITRKEFRDAVNESSDSTHVEKESMNSDSLDSSSLLSSDSALGVTSEDEKRTSTYLSKKELVLKTTDIEYSSEKSYPVETSYRNQIDSGLGESVSSPSFSPESDFKEKFWTSQSSSVEEEVLLQNDDTSINREQHVKTLSSKEPPEAIATYRFFGI